MMSASQASISSNGVSSADSSPYRRRSPCSSSTLRTFSRSIPLCDNSEPLDRVAIPSTSMSSPFVDRSQSLFRRSSLANSWPTLPKPIRAKRRIMEVSPLACSYASYRRSQLRELFLPSTALGTRPIVREFLKWSPGLNRLRRVALRWVIDVATYVALVFHRLCHRADIALWVLDIDCVGSRTRACLGGAPRHHATEFGFVISICVRALSPGICNPPRKCSIRYT